MSTFVSLKNFSHTPTFRLTSTYLTIIMLMSIAFSTVFYNTSVRQLERPLPQRGFGMREEVFRQTFGTEFDSLLEERTRQAKNTLLVRLVILNSGALAVGAVLSYYLARKSLRPIEETMDAQTQFVSDASHEIRTPLTVLETTNEVALRKTKISQQEIRELLGYNIAEVRKLKDLSNALLDLLKNPDKETVLRDIEIQDALGEALASVVPAALVKNIKVVDKVDKLSVKSDSTLLARLFSILLDNAVKYSEQNKKIIITSSVQTKYVTINFKDQGMGISASDLPHIFRRFYRADKSRTAQYENGYGLGLALAERLAQRLDAKIFVESTQGKGSTFSVKIPR